MGAGAEACAAAFQGRVACADLRNGSLRWTRELGAGSGIARDRSGIYVVDLTSQVHGLAANGGASLWRNDRLTHRALTTPAALPAAVAVGDLAGFVHFLTPAEGRIVARVQVDSSAIVARPLPVDDRSLLVQTSDGTLALLALGR